jgi:hypothetical protein
LSNSYIAVSLGDTLFAVTPSVTVAAQVITRDMYNIMNGLELVVDQTHTLPRSVSAMHSSPVPVRGSKCVDASVCFEPVLDPDNITLFTQQLLCEKVTIYSVSR